MDLGLKFRDRDGEIVTLKPVSGGVGDSESKEETRTIFVGTGVLNPLMI